MQHWAPSKTNGNRFKLTYLSAKFLGTGDKKEREKYMPRLRNQNCSLTTSKDRRWRRSLNFYSWKFFALSSVRQLNIILWVGDIKFHKFNLLQVFLKIIRSHTTTQAWNKDQKRKIYDPGPKSSTQKVKVMPKKGQPDTENLYCVLAKWEA